jgi:hypothetical protein
MSVGGLAIAWAIGRDFLGHTQVSSDVDEEVKSLRLERNA